MTIYWLKMTVHWFQMVIYWFQMRIYWFQMTTDWFHMTIKWFNMTTDWLLQMTIYGFQISFFHLRRNSQHELTEIRQNKQKSNIKETKQPFSCGRQVGRQNKPNDLDKISHIMMIKH